MATFVDTFDRANGALGGNWTTVSGNVSISGNLATTSSTGVAINSTVSGGGRQQATSHVFRPLTVACIVGPVVKAHGAGSGGFCLSIRGTAAPWTLSLIGANSISQSPYASVDLVGTPAVYNKLSVVWDNGHVSGYLNDQLLLEFDSALWADGDEMGIAYYQANGTIDDFTAISGAAVQLTVAPSPIGNYGSAVAVTFTGTNTAWTPGTPGAPAFTVDHGTLSAQTVDTSTTAHATYDPGLFLGVATFTDPSTGATCQVTVTSNVGVVPTSGTFLDQTVVDYLYRSANAETDAYIANRTTNIAVTGPAIELKAGLASIRLSTVDKTYSEAGDPGVNLLGQILWALVNGGNDPLAGPWTHADGTPLSETLGLLIERWDTLITGSNYTLGDVITNITGLGVPTIKDVRDDIAALDLGGTTDLTPVLDAISSMRGDDIATLAQVVDILGQIRTVSTYHFGSVLTWIQAMQGSGTPTIKQVRDDIAALHNAPAYSDANVLTAISDNTDLVTAIKTALLLYLDPEGATVQLILDAIGGIETTPGSGPPLWPGVGGVTLGTEVALSDGLTLTEPMHGVLVTITGHLPSAGKYGFADVMSWRNVGAVMFGDGSGIYERPESIGVDSMVVTVKSMIQAQECIVRLGNGFTGTIQPWTLAG